MPRLSSWANIDSFYKKKDRPSTCATREQDRESIIPLLNMSSSSERRIKHGEAEAKTAEVGKNMSAVGHGMYWCSIPAFALQLICGDILRAKCILIEEQ